MDGAYAVERDGHGSDGVERLEEVWDETGVSEVCFDGGDVEGNIVGAA